MIIHFVHNCSSYQQPSSLPQQYAPQPSLAQLASSESEGRVEIRFKIFFKSLILDLFQNILLSSVL